MVCVCVCLVVIVHHNDGDGDCMSTFIMNILCKNA
jgi:hypothetical protein